MDNKFLDLYNKNVSDYIEKKNGLSYLSWAYAWAEFKKTFPDASYEIKRDERQKAYFGDGEAGYMVYTSVTADGLTYEMWLPVMDFKNKSILKPTTYDVNKAIMRCLTKNLAMFGLGLYIYAGEDLPEKETAKAHTAGQKQGTREITAEMAGELEALAKSTGTAIESILKNYSVSNIYDMTARDYKGAMQILKLKQQKQQKAG